MSGRVPECLTQQLRSQHRRLAATMTAVAALLVTMVVWTTGHEKREVSRMAATTRAVRNFCIGEVLASDVSSSSTSSAHRSIDPRRSWQAHLLLLAQQQPFLRRAGEVDSDGDPTTQRPFWMSAFTDHNNNKQKVHTTTTDKKIPHTIYMTSRSVPTLVTQERMLKWHSQNPSWVFIYQAFPEETDQFVRDQCGHRAWRAFRRLRDNGLQRDLWRYCVLAQKGGLVIDPHFAAIDGLSLHDFQPAVGGPAAGNDAEWVGLVRNVSDGDDLIATGFMGSSPQHPLSKALLRELVRRVEERVPMHARHSGSRLAVDVFTAIMKQTPGRVMRHAEAEVPLRCTGELPHRDESTGGPAGTSLRVAARLLILNPPSKSCAIGGITARRPHHDVGNTTTASQKGGTPPQPASRLLMRDEEAIYDAHEAQVGNAEHPRTLCPGLRVSPPPASQPIDGAESSSKTAYLSNREFACRYPDLLERAPGEARRGGPDAVVERVAAGGGLEADDGATRHRLVTVPVIDGCVRGWRYTDEAALLFAIPPSDVDWRPASALRGAVAVPSVRSVGAIAPSADGGTAAQGAVDIPRRMILQPWRHDVAPPLGGRVPALLFERLRRVDKLHPTFEVLRHDNAQRRNATRELCGPRALDAYDAATRTFSMSGIDVFTFCYLWAKGGIYLATDVELYDELDVVLTNDNVPAVILVADDERPTFFDGFMASLVPGHSLMKQFLDVAVDGWLATPPSLPVPRGTFLRDGYLSYLRRHAVSRGGEAVRLLNYQRHEPCWIGVVEFLTAAGNASTVLGAVGKPFMYHRYVGQAAEVQQAAAVSRHAGGTAPPRNDEEGGDDAATLTAEEAMQV